MLTRLGPYRLLHQIGEGGMGAVYEAQRDDGQFEQRVAIKILRPGVTQPERFESERRILAQLHHPYIANLVDGGTFEGTPYIVMELVQGLPMDQFARQQRLNLRERLDLFILVCQAVQHAHSLLIVHRDLKPANILVTPDGIPKLLDFGIARHHGSASTMAAPLTPHYASPEQFSGGTITTASDVYSLGVLLRELVDGLTRPDDLTNVLAMATRQEPQRRYGSVAQFAEDIQRYLDGMMVIARPDTIGYRWSTFSRRNRIPLTLAALLMLVVLVGSAFVYREGTRAQRRFDEVHSLLQSVLTEMDAEAAPLLGSGKVRKLMVEKALNYLNRLAEESGGDRALLQELARAYHKVGDIQGHRRGQSLEQYNESLESHLKAIQIEEALLADDRNNASLRSQMALGYAHIAELYSMRGGSEKAVAYAALAKPLATPADPASFIETNIAISRVLHFEGRLEEALELLQAALKLANDSTPVSRLVGLLKWASEEAHFLGRLPLALEYSNTSIQLLERMAFKGNEISRLNSARRDRGSQLSQAINPSEEKHCEAIPDLEFAVDGQTDTYRRDPRSINRLVQAVTAMEMLAASQALCGKPEAVATVHAAFDLYNRDKRRKNPSLDWHLVFVHFKLGHLREATLLAEKVQDPDENLQELMAEIAIAKGELAQARSLLANVRAKRQAYLKRVHFERYFAHYYQARNITLALRAKDTTPGLREEALQLLRVFPESGVARSILRLRSELQP